MASTVAPATFSQYSLKILPVLEQAGRVTVMFTVLEYDDKSELSVAFGNRLPHRVLDYPKPCYKELSDLLQFCQIH